MSANRHPDSAIEIRPALPDDAGAIVDYHEQCFRTTYASQLAAGEFGVPDRDGTREQLHGWFQHGSPFDTDVAIIDDEPIGHITVLDHQLVHLFVHPDHQGTGLGRRLLKHGEAKIEADGHREFELHARVENVGAITFYESFGWVVTDQLIRTVEHGIDYQERVLVKRSVSDGL